MKSLRDSRLPPDVLIAEYRPAALAIHRGNPLIEALPPQAEAVAMMKAFGKFPHVSDVERRLPPSIRMQAISRLDNYLEPLTQHFEVTDQLSLILRAGYMYRKPASKRFQKEQRQLFYAKTLDGLVHPFTETTPSTAPSTALFGMSGLGKSTAVEQTLSFFPPALCHPKFGFVQVVWIKLDCPVGGNLKDLLLSLLAAIDALIGTSYRPKRRSDQSIPELVFSAAKISASHFLGLLVIDEIQNLIDASGVGPDVLMQFFVMFANVVKIPVAVIGTPRALSYLKTTFHGARRSGSYGSIIWQPMRYDEEWEHFLRCLLCYQWTAEPIAFGIELSSLLYYLTQGVHALVVRLFQLTQIESIRSEEPMSADLFKRVAFAKFRLVEPMLEALRSKKKTDTKKYDDLLIRELDNLKADADRSGHLVVLEEQARSRRQADARRMHAISALVAVDYEEALAGELVDRILDDFPELDAVSVVHRVLDTVRLRIDTGQSRSLKDIVASADPSQTPADALRAAGLITLSAKLDNS